MRIKEINQLYHRIITSDVTLTDKEKFIIQIREIKDIGYRFRPGVPTIDYKGYNLNTYETKLFIRLEVIRVIKLDAIDESLYWFATYMRDAEKHLSREIFVSLCKRSVLGTLYFQLGDRKRIEFMQSGNAIDIYPLFNSTNQHLNSK